MEGTDFDELEFFGALARSGARALLIGRRALVVLGIPVLTADYDFWLDADDIETLNAVARRFGLRPTHAPGEARARGRYVLENDERVDVLVARTVDTVDGETVSHADVWSRRRGLPTAGDGSVAIPSLDDLIATKRFASRPKDVEDIRLLEAFRQRESGDR